MSSIGGRPRGRRRPVEEEHVNHERWLISYSDMITVLMALFIVLFAISQVDQEKYIALRDSLSAGFLDTVSNAWEGLDPDDYPITRALAKQVRDHDDREQFLAGVDLVLAGITAVHALDK